MLRKTLFLTFLLTLLAGCANNMQLYVQSLPDPSYQLDYQAPVTVVPEGSAESILKAKYYLAQVKDQLTLLGFKQVSIGSEKTTPKDGLLIKVSVTTEQSSYKYNATDYGYTYTDQTTYCQKGKHDKVVCNTNYRPVYGPVGSSERTAYTRRSELRLTGIDNKTHEPVLQVRSVSYNDNCADSKVEDFLVEQTLNRLDLKNRFEQQIKLDMPDSYSCK